MILLLLAAVTLIAFEPIRGNDFVGSDDVQYVTDNENVQAGLTKDSIVWAFTTTYASNWHPLTWISHMTDFQLFGDNPTGHYFHSLVIHIANVLLLFWILRTLTGATWASVFCAMLFAVHPLRVESVAWIAERKDVLSGLFWMLATIAFIKYTQKPSVKRYFIIALLFCLGLMAKPMIVTLPFVLLLLDFWPLKRFGSKAIIEKTPLFLISIASCIVTMIVQTKSGATQAVGDLSFIVRLQNAIVSCVGYITKMFVPKDLAILYPHPGNSISLLQTAVALIVLIAISATAIYYARKKPYLSVGWLWYLGTLIPVIGLVQVGYQSMADRYTYIPMIGLSLMLSMAARDICDRFRAKTACCIGAMIVVTALIILTRIQVEYFTNGVTLFAHTVEVTDNNFVAYNNLGCALEKQGDIEKALENYNKAVQIKEYATAYRNIGDIMLSRGKIDEALVNYNKALQIVPGRASTHLNIGNLYSKQKNFNKAAEHFRKAIAIDENYPKAYNNLGNLSLLSKQYDKAAENFRKAIELKDDYVNPMISLAKILLLDGSSEHDKTEALAIATRAARITEQRNPRSLEALALALAANNKKQEALATAKKALKLAPAANIPNLTRRLQKQITDLENKN